MKYSVLLFERHMKTREFCQNQFKNLKDTINDTVAVCRQSTYGSMPLSPLLKPCM